MRIVMIHLSDGGNRSIHERDVESITFHDNAPIPHFRVALGRDKAICYAVTGVVAWSEDETLDRDWSFWPPVPTA